jgi:hypothetical protein
MNSADLSVFQSDLDSARVERSAGEDVSDYAFRKASGVLVSFQDDRNREAGTDVFSALAVHSFSCRHCSLFVQISMMQGVPQKVLPVGQEKMQKLQRWVITGLVETTQVISIRR